MCKNIVNRHLFPSGVRKVAKKYIHYKFFGESLSDSKQSDLLNFIPTNEAYNRCTQLITQAIPPTSRIDIEEEVDHIFAHFKGISLVDNYEFSSLVLENKLWQEAGETVVKELIFLDRYLCMYLYIYLRMYLCIYLCMHVSMHMDIHVHMDV